MGNEISTLSGAAATVVTAVAAGVTCGQVRGLNEAVKSTAEFTAKSFMKTNVRHVGEVVGTSVAAAATLGQCKSINAHLCKSAKQCGSTLLETANGMADGIPVVGHIKGGVHLLMGDKEGGAEALKSASRSVGVMVGGAVGMCVGGPVGAAAGGVAGGAVADGITTGVDSAAHGEYRPAGQVAAWTKAVNAKTPNDCIEGIVGIASTLVGDALAGRSAGKAAKKFNEKISGSTERVYSVVPEDAAKKMVKEQKLTQNPRSSGPLGETCVTESAGKHSAKFIEQRQAQNPNMKMECVKIKVDGPAWRRAKAKAIPQSKSKATNLARIDEGKTPLNVTTQEKIVGTGKINMNIKRDNLGNFNKSVQKVKRINPRSFKYRSPAHEDACRIGKPIAKGAVAAAADPLPLRESEVCQRGRKRKLEESKSASDCISAQSPKRLRECSTGAAFVSKTAKRRASSLQSEDVDRTQKEARQRKEAEERDRKEDAGRKAEEERKQREAEPKRKEEEEERKQREEDRQRKEAEEKKQKEEEERKRKEAEQKREVEEEKKRKEQQRRKVEIEEKKQKEEEERKRKEAEQRQKEVEERKRKEEEERKRKEAEQKRREEEAKRQRVIYEQKRQVFEAQRQSLKDNIKAVAGIATVNIGLANKAYIKMKSLDDSIARLQSLFDCAGVVGNHALKTLVAQRANKKQQWEAFSAKAKSANAEKSKLNDSLHGLRAPSLPELSFLKSGDLHVPLCA